MWKKICLFEEGKEFIWSDNWWFDDGIWFVAGDMNFLFHIEKDKNEAVCVSRIPSRNTHEFRNYPRCMKKGDIIFCFPDEGDSIGCYHLEDSTWKNVYIDNPDKVRLSCVNMWFVQDKIYIVSVGLRKIIEFDIKEQEIDKYYDLKTEEITGSVLVGENIYIVDSSLTGIYKFNCLNKSIKKYLLPEIHDHIRTICFDGHKFWMSGQKKKLYIWKESVNEISTIDISMSDLWGNQEKICDTSLFLFLYTVMVGEYIWLIPFQTNKILYINKYTCKIKEFPLENEDQTDEDIKMQLLRHKYLLEYVKENRYIGIFSLKNKWVFEIDTKKLTYRVLKYRLNTESASKILYEVSEDKHIFFEKESVDLKYLLLMRQKIIKPQNKSIVGKKIFFALK